MSLGRGKGRLDPNIGFLARLRKRREPRQQQFIREEWRHIQANDRSAKANLKLLRDRFELGEDIADVLEVVRAGIGQPQGAHAALEQAHAELLLERLDLMADSGWGDEQFFGSGFEALQSGRDLKRLQKLERRQAHGDNL